MHVPVLKKEAIEYLNVKSNENFIDCTLGEAGHTLAILEKNGPKGKVLGIDWSEESLENTRDKIRNTAYENRLILVRDNFVNLKSIAEKEKFGRVSGILLDLGLSSWLLANSKRGFSFSSDEPLDMRYSLDTPVTAEKILNYWSGKDIEVILKEYGEEQFAKKITEVILEARRVKRIKSTSQLGRIVKNAVPAWYQRNKINPATKTFQALRIAVNDELNNLTKILPQTIDILVPEGRLIVISFHSLEDRIVKNFLKDNVKKGHLKILTKKPVVPAKQELNYNPRSRSAKLRAATKL